MWKSRSSKMLELAVINYTRNNESIIADPELNDLLSEYDNFVCEQAVVVDSEVITPGTSEQFENTTTVQTRQVISTSKKHLQHLHH